MKDIMFGNVNMVKDFLFKVGMWLKQISKGNLLYFPKYVSKQNVL